MHPFLQALAGGALIGCAASILWLLQGRIAGISGIAGRLLATDANDRPWRVEFLCGLLAGAFAMSRAMPSAYEAPPFSLGVAVAAGALVGVGTTLSNGCTSGHGVCGISRLSKRSLAATATFMLVGAAVVYVSRHVLGGA